VSASPPDGWPALLRRHGLRATPARAAVLQSLAALGHGTPEEVLAHASSTVQALNSSTVYRTLEALADARVVTHTHLTHQKTTYMLADHADHAHLVCRGCGRVTELAVDLTTAFGDEVHRRHGFSADTGHLSVFGRCAACAAAPVTEGQSFSEGESSGTGQSAGEGQSASGDQSVSAG